MPALQEHQGLGSLVVFDFHISMECNLKLCAGPWVPQRDRETNNFSAFSLVKIVNTNLISLYS